MRFHFCESPDLSQIDVLSVSQCNDFIKGKDERERLPDNLRFFNGFTILRNLNHCNENTNNYYMRFSMHEIYNVATADHCDGKDFEIVGAKIFQGPLV